MNPDRTTKLILRLDAAFCLALALPGLLASGWLAGFLFPDQSGLFGFSMATVMLEIGILLAAYAALLFVMSLRPMVNRGFLAFTAIGDALWVLGTMTLLALAGPAFSLWGALVLLVVAADTGLLGLWKWRALRGSATTVHA